MLREGKATVISNGDCREEFRGAITGNNICTLTPYVPPSENASAAPPPRRRLLRQANITNEESASASPEPEPVEETTEGVDEANTVETQPEYVSPCLVGYKLLISRPQV